MINKLTEKFFARSISATDQSELVKVTAVGMRRGKNFDVNLCG
jgi:hypothetical protein